MKILRLAYFNIKKHRVESISLFVLIALCMALIATAVTGISDTSRIFDEAFEQIDCVSGFVHMPTRYYKEKYKEFFENDERVERSFVLDFIYNNTTQYLTKDGEEKNFTGVFITAENDAKMENINLESSMTLEEISTMEHAIIAPYYAKDVLKYKEGDTFSIICNDKVYPFTIAGFYESGFFSSSIDMKFIINKKDHMLMSHVLGSSRMICIDMKNIERINEVIYDFYNFADKNAVRDEAEQIKNFHMTFYDEKEFRLTSTNLFTTLMFAMAVVVMVSIGFMIVFRIKDDIDEQLVSIGVLEALGYRSWEISFSYMAEYILIALPAVIFGDIISLFTSPIIIHIAEQMIGHHRSGGYFSSPSIVAGILILGVVAAISFFNALRIRKYPPVLAFRKGTGDHTHKHNVFPLEKTRRSVCLRMAMKELFTDIRSNIGMCLCISLSVVSLIVCFVIFSFASGSSDNLLAKSGMEVADLGFITTAGTDTAELKREILEMPEVENVLLLNNTTDSYVFCKNTPFCVLAYEDYDELKSLCAMDGRMPKHENEAAMQSKKAAQLQKGIGDTITLRIGKIETDYVICGLVDEGFITMDDYIYMTPEGCKRIKPAFVPEQVDIFLREGEDVKAFKSKLTERYGAPKSAFEAEGGSAGLEESIRAEADSKISAMLEMYGVNRVDYAIQVGDRLIKGSSSRFRIQYFTFLVEIILCAFAPIISSIKAGTGMFMGISAYTIIMIVFLVIHSAVRKKRAELGIMKGLGYTSSELMMKTALRMLPVLLFAVTVGCVAGVYTAGIVFSKYGEIPVVTGKIVLIGAGVAVFGFLTAYLSAGKIKNISVYELMQE